MIDINQGEDSVLDDDLIPNISTAFDLSDDQTNLLLYHCIVRNALKHLLPPNLFSPKINNCEQIDQFHRILPLFKSIHCDNVPCNISFYLVSKQRPNSFRFFYDMIAHWLIPGKRVNIILLNSADFRLPNLGNGNYTVCEAMIHIEDPVEFETIKQNLPIIEAEIRMGIESSYYARRILEIKGLSADAKTALIQEYIAYLIKRKPNAFDYDLLTEMQHVLVMCSDDFKAIRDCRHLSRIISFSYLFCKTLRSAVKTHPEKRHLSIKLFKTHLRIPNGEKRILGIIVGMNFIREKEVFAQKHLFNAIQHYVPDARPVPNSFFINRRGTEHICTLYLELEKEDGTDFTSEEVSTLRRELPINLKDHIEHTMHPIFMPRNEEEIMRNILTLGSQIKYLRDVPQVCISFDEQTHTHLYFTIIAVRVMTPGSASIQNLFKNVDSFLNYIHDRCKTVGFMRKKYTKEATVFRVQLPKEEFLRRDQSIDLYKARQTVSLELLRVLGEFRDFNGGMITKQNEQLETLRVLLQSQYKFNDIFLENFFYSLTPVVMRTVLDTDVLKNLFAMLLKTKDKKFSKGESCLAVFQRSPNFLYAMIKTEHRAVKEELSRMVARFLIPSSELTSSYVQAYDIHYYGLIYRSDDPQKQDSFCETVQSIQEKFS